MSQSDLVTLAGSSCRCVNSLLKGQQLSSWKSDSWPGKMPMLGSSWLADRQR